MGSVKRRPMLPGAVRDVFASIPKSEWAELYVDLYRATHGEGATGADIVRDIQKRNKTLGYIREHYDADTPEYDRLRHDSAGR